MKNKQKAEETKPGGCCKGKDSGKQYHEAHYVVSSIHGAYNANVKNSVSFLAELVSREHFQAAVDMIPLVMKQVDGFSGLLQRKAEALKKEGSSRNLIEFAKSETEDGCEVVEPDPGLEPEPEPEEVEYMDEPCQEEDMLPPEELEGEWSETESEEAEEPVSPM